MFIIARRRGQRIEIGDDIAIIVTEISRNMVKIGIEAPRTCLIARGELKESVARANREAALCSVAAADPTALTGKDPAPALPELGDREPFMLASVNRLASIDVSEATERAREGK